MLRRRAAAENPAFSTTLTNDVMVVRRSMSLDPRFATAGSPVNAPLRIAARHHHGDRIARGKGLFERIVEQTIQIMLGLIEMRSVCRRTDPFRTLRARARLFAFSELVFDPCHSSSP